MLKDKVAMVTGAGQGLGRHLAERLSNEGCKVAVLDINEDAVKETASLLKESIAIKLMSRNSNSWRKPLTGPSKNSEGSIF